MSTAVAKLEPKEAGERIVALVDARADQLRSLIGNDDRLYERFRTVALHAVTSNPKLLQADPASILEAIRDSATLGLEPNGLMGEGYVLPYYDKKRGKYVAQFQVGWRGLLKLIRRSGDVASVDAQVVYEADDFDVDLGTDPRIRHKPNLTQRGKRLGAYAYARLHSGELVIEWMSDADIALVRRASKAADDGPWVDWPDEMARKTVVKRLAKRLPLAHVAERALEIEARADQEYDRPPAAPKARPTGAIAKIHERLGIAAEEGDFTEDTQTDADDTQHVNPADVPADPAPEDSGSDRAASVCGASPGDLGGDDVCQEASGHSGPHKSPEAVWPA